VRKFCFFYLAKSIVMFPGGFGTMDEFFELLTLVQTGKSRKKMSIVLYGGDYWRSIVNFEAMVEWGMISPEDLDLFKIIDDVDETVDYIKQRLQEDHIKR
jgi:predicted Rossmann-fold nucleotide-binding protein